MIAGLVLAAGSSQRMEGGPKQLLPFGRHTMAGHVVSVVERTSLDPIVVVTGHAADEVRAGIEPQRATFAHNPRFETGNMSSLHVGIDALGSRDAVMILLADQPEVTVEIIETMAAAWRQFIPFAALAHYRGEVGHPWVLSEAAVEGSAEMEGTKMLFGWLTDDHRDDVILVEFDRPKPSDVNTRADYHAVLARLGVDDVAG